MTIFDEFELQGIEKGIEIVAIRLWRKGVEVNIIADLLDLSFEQVERMTVDSQETAIT